MSKEERKIGFYQLQLTDKTEDRNIVNPKDIFELIRDINQSLIKDKIIDEYKKYIAYSMDSVTDKGNTIFVSMIAAKYNHRPKHFNKITGEERTNSKTIDEGDKEVTHLGLKLCNDEIIVIKEERKVGITINQFIEYLKKMISLRNITSDVFKDNILKIAVIPKGDFQSELNNLTKVLSAEIHANKRLLGNEYFNFGKRLEPIKKTFKIIIAANRGESILKPILEFYDGIYTKMSNDEFEKIRVIGKDENSNTVLLDSDLVKKIEKINVDLDPSSRVVDRVSIFKKFEEMLNETNQI